MTIKQTMPTNKYSVLEIIQFLILLILVSAMLITLQLLSKQVSDLSSHLIATTDSLSALREELSHLKVQCLEQQNLIFEMRQQSVRYKSELVELVTKTSTSDLALLVERNNMIRFCVNAAILTLGCIFFVSAVQGVIGPAESAQCKPTLCFHHDESTSTSWRIHIEDTREVTLGVRPGCSDIEYSILSSSYMSLKDWLTLLKLEWRQESFLERVELEALTRQESAALGRLASQSLPPETFIDISGIPSGTLLDVAELQVAAYAETLPYAVAIFNTPC